MDQGLERFMSQVDKIASSVLQFEECEKELELNGVSLRKRIMELKEKEERLKVIEEKEMKLKLLEKSITEKREESEAEQFLEADLTRLVVEMQVKEVVNQLREKEISLGLLQDSTVKKHQELMRALEAKKKEFGLLEDSMEKKHEEIVRKLEALKEEVGLVEDSLAKKNEGLMKELEGWKEEVGLMNEFELKKTKESEKRKEEAEVMETSIKKKLEAMIVKAGLISKSVDEKSCELAMEVNEFELKKTAETEKRKEEAEKLDAREKELNLLNETIKKKKIKLKKKEKKFKLKLKLEIKKIIDKEKFLGVKEKELKESMRKLNLKQRDLEEGFKTRKRSRFELGASSLAVNDIDPDYLILLEKNLQHNHNGKEKWKETDLAERRSEAERRDVDEIICIDPEPFNCPDPDFNEFSNTMSLFAKGQVWALYDPIDDMPRYYARIESVSEPELSVQVTWLESVLNTANEKLIPIACGRFEEGTSEEDKSHLMFSHEMKPIIVGKSFFINPLIGETWALFRDWNKNWKTTQKELHKPPYSYDFVEIESEFDDVYGIAVAYLGRVKGFTSVFERRAAEEHGFIRMMISPDDMLRFSHRVPSFKLTGDEKEGVQAGSFELDPAALPRGLFEVRKEETIVLD